MTTSPHPHPKPWRVHDITRSLEKGLVAACLIAGAGQGMANNVGENSAWQFQTSADKANQAAIQDMVQRRKAGSYGAASTTNNTYIQRQFNCDVSATAQGNQGSNSTVANSPSTSGAAATSTGNDNTGWSGSGTVSTGQANAGTVGSQVNGSTTTGVQGWAAQALNSNQTNSGSQSASVSGSTACAYGTLN
ncbi:hypothetical protein SAMN05443579_10662 [Variovorax sp. PDC80]|uniref:hypothetical protein n=1 Tax=Variovorax sp. PDC80 TaxID=1882827 RepID=UPI0008F03A10|nr:hypothetical protein [Variovorax sp. PDC80]SFO77447.1 hypothetical protein SAMN05443579_10662 [Variovorax sp. PDC80]